MAGVLKNMADGEAANDAEEEAEEDDSVDRLLLVCTERGEEKEINFKLMEIF